MDKLDQIALQLLCATIAKNGINDFGSMLWAAYNGAERMIEFRENKEKHKLEQIERLNREKHSDIRGNKELTCRTQNALYVEGIYQLSELSNWSERELRKIPNLGKKSIEELKLILANRGLSLKDA